MKMNTTTPSNTSPSNKKQNTQKSAPCQLTKSKNFAPKTRYQLLQTFTLSPCYEINCDFAPDYFPPILKLNHQAQDKICKKKPNSADSPSKNPKANILPTKNSNPKYPPTTPKTQTQTHAHTHTHTHAHR